MRAALDARTPFVVIVPFVIVVAPFVIVPFVILVVKTASKTSIIVSG